MFLKMFMRSFLTLWNRNATFGGFEAHTVARFADAANAAPFLPLPHPHPPPYFCTSF